MKVATYEAIVENGQIKLTEPVSLPEHAIVYVMVPDIEKGRVLHFRSPHFVRREDAADFTMTVTDVAEGP